MNKKEKIWSVKGPYHHGRRGKSHTGKGFPRKRKELFEGNHLGMSSTLLYDNYNGLPWLSKRYIIGLLNKYVGKPFKGFMEAWSKRTKGLSKKYGSQIFDSIKDYISNSENDPERKRYSYRRKYYIDSEGILRRKKPKTKKKEEELTQAQRIFNSKVKIPDFGAARVFPDGPLYQQFRKPLLLGKFYVVVNQKVLKLPVYACEFLMEGYYDFIYHRKEEKNPSWIPVKVDGFYGYQDHMVTLKNKNREEAIWALSKEQLNPQADPVYISNLKEIIDNSPEYKEYNLGYGTFCTFIKRRNYEI